MIGFGSLAIDRASLRFVALFALGLACLGSVFEAAPTVFQHLYMLPVSHLSTALLQAVTVDAIIDTSHLGDGFCELAVSRILYRITFDCTGIFAVLAFTSLTLAYPATWQHKASGLALGLPAIFAFSVLRIAVLGVVATIEPDWIEIFHVYVME